MKTHFEHIKLSAVASALPKETLDLTSLAAHSSEEEIKRIVRSTGVESVHVASHGMTTSDLCLAAARQLLTELAVNPQTIDAIVVVSQTSDRIAPATSVMMQHLLGLPTHALAFDINYGCSGYIYGLYQAALLITAGNCRKVLVCTGDVITPLLHQDARQLRMLLGDAGTATLVELGFDDWQTILNSDGAGAEHLTAARSLPNQILSQAIDDKRNGYYHMDGNQVMSFAMRVVPETVDALLMAKGWLKSGVGTFALHQPNTFMLNFLRKKLDISAEALPIAVKHVGNTGPASIPLLLSMKGNELKANQQLERTIMAGFGVGLSWGGVALNLGETQFFEPIEI